MWIARELVKLAARVLLAFVLALVLAAFWAVVSEGGFETALRRTCLGIGCLLLLMGGIGRNSNFERAATYAPTEQLWGRIPGTSALRSTGEDRTLAPGAVFFLAGAALLGLALVVL